VWHIRRWPLLRQALAPVSRSSSPGKRQWQPSSC
jgi:hypothetical protein